jgi:rhomboid protease GluP
VDHPQPVVFVLRETLLSRKPDPLAAFAMALATLLVVLISTASRVDFAGVDSWMRASREAVFVHHQYWRAWTSLFVHGDAKHLLSNVFLFFILGSFLTGYFGICRVLLWALVFGGFINLLVLPSLPLEVDLIGLSGVVFWMGGAWLILYFLIDRKRSLVQRSLRVMGIGLALFMPAEAFDPSISYESHLVGFLLGILAGLLYFSFERKKLRGAEVYEIVRTEDENSPDF